MKKSEIIVYDLKPLVKSQMDLLHDTFVVYKLNYVIELRQRLCSSFSPDHYSFKQGHTTIIYLSYILVLVPCKDNTDQATSSFQ